MSGTVSPLARSRSASRSICATSWAVLRLLMDPSVAQFTGGLPFRLDQFLGSRPLAPAGHFLAHRCSSPLKHRLGSLGPPEAYGSVVAARDEDRVVGGESECVDLGLVLLESEQLLPGEHVPDPDRHALARRCLTPRV